MKAAEIKPGDVYEGGSGVVYTVLQTELVEHSNGAPWVKVLVRHEVDGGTGSRAWPADEDTPLTTL